jgi:hypothetical protein
MEEKFREIKREMTCSQNRCLVAVIELAIKIVEGKGKQEH